MDKIRVDAKSIVGDIKERLGLKTLMEKHGLTYRNLLKVRDLLLEKGWITSEEVDYLNLPDASAQITVQAEEFLASFRNRPDDFHLMDRFSLKTRDLKRIYERLIQAGLLSEYEYHCRDRKAPDLEEPTANSGEASTEVTLLRGAFDEVWGVSRDEEVSPPGDSSRIRTRADKSPSIKLPNRHSRLTAGSEGSTREEITPVVCPNCGSPSHDSSPNACVQCGIVFSKVKQVPKDKRISVWQFDYGIR